MGDYSQQDGSDDFQVLHVLDWKVGVLNFFFLREKPHPVDEYLVTLLTHFST